MVDKFGLADAKTVDTPLPPKVVLDSDVNGTPLSPQVHSLYRALVGGVLHLARFLRPDVAFAVTQLARYQKAPTALHWDMGKHVLRYLKGTSTLGIVYQSLVREQSVAAQLVPTLGELQLYGFVDASWAEDPTRRSQSAYVFMLGNAAVSWRSKLQSIVATSSCEAEYVALSAAVKEALYLRSLLADVLSAPRQSVVLLEDNQSCIKFAHNVENVSDRTKHIDIRYHHVKDHVHKGDVTLTYVPTEHQAADGLTKSLDRVKHQSHCLTIFGLV
eukprot:m.211283 g.211283  ORF g.211283 m.211283 type:complete len:273 (+) comp15559_c3_seq2:760-1578(+)